MQGGVDNKSPETCNDLSRQPWDIWAIGLAIVLTCGVSFSLPYAEPDLWGHVQYGRDVLTDRLPQTTTYSFTAKGHPWINHENLSELSFAYAIDHFGLWSLLLGKFLLGLLIVGTMAYEARRKGVSWLVIAGTALVVSCTLSSYWQVRPHLFSFGLFTALVFLLGHAFDGWQGSWHLPVMCRWARASSEPAIRPDRKKLRLLWATPVLLAIWANAHGGFVAGGLVFYAYLVFRCIEASTVDQRRAWSLVRQLGPVALVAGLATFLTPYGFRLHSWLFESLYLPRPEITEWQPMSFGSEAYLPFFLLVMACALGLSASRRSLDATQLVILALVGWQAITHQRHVPFFAILAGFWLPVHWQSLVTRLASQRRLQPEDRTPIASPPRWLWAALIGVNITLVALLIPRMTHLRVPKSEYPVDALQFMADQNLNGRMVVTYNWAQYVIAALGTNEEQVSGVQVSFDGRFRTCYPQDVIDAHFDFVLGTDADSCRSRHVCALADTSRVLQSGDPELVLISRLQVPSVRVMQQNTDEWALLYQDQLAQLWGRRSKFDDAESPHYLADADRKVAEAPQEGIVAWPAMPRREAPAERTVAALR